MAIHATVAGIPRIGPNRELKIALEKYWRDPATAGLLAATARGLVHRYIDSANAAGIDSIPTVGRSFYDSMLDTSALLGVLPSRFDTIPDCIGANLPAWIDRYFATARGTETQPASAMTKWFDTNYHYIVPELSSRTVFRPDVATWLGEACNFRAYSKGVIRPHLIGPYTYLALARTDDGSDPLALLEQLVDAYQDIIVCLGAEGFEWVQLDEPIAVTDIDDGARQRLRRCYQVLSDAAEAAGAKLWVQTYFGDGDQALEIFSGTGVGAIGVDLVAGGAELPHWTGQEVLVAGIVDGRNVWRRDLDEALNILENLADRGEIIVSTSCSLLHVPYSLRAETPTESEAEIHDWLAFGEEKIAEVALLARVLQARINGTDITADDAAALRRARVAVGKRATSELIHNERVERRVAAVGEQDRTRTPFERRRAVQEKTLNLPELPTTTIGSFPQTAEIRRARAQLRRGDLTPERYDAAMIAEIREVIERQEELGLDVLVHGEPERNDMVQYFSEQLDGYLATTNGWVQSYGSRCVRPPILFGDVSRPEPMTVRWYEAAATMTSRQVKGMLTGPVTMLAWSFVRDDQPLGTTADQVALALRDEIADLVAAGARIIQVDEPAIRELLPLRKEDQPAYLEWAVGSFRLATAGVADDIQIHTHMCYSEFNELIGTIGDLDADVTSIEAARNGMQVLAALSNAGYAQGIGPGVWDIHSPRVPGQQEVDDLISDALASVDPKLLWINPDCGLKTRGWPETIASLKVLVKAAKKARSAAEPLSEVRAGAEPVSEGARVL